MKKIIAAVDFSEPSVNAAGYALQLAKDIVDASLTLYYVFDRITPGSDGTPLLVDAEARKTIALTALNNLKNDIGDPGRVLVDVVAEEGSLTGNLETYVKHHSIDLVVMGITGSTKLEQIIIGSNTLNVISKDICPILIVPTKATYKKIRNAVFMSDLQNVEETTPLKPLTDFLDTVHPQLYIVNVVSDHAAVPDTNKIEKEKLEQILKEYNPKCFFLLEQDFTTAIEKFADEYSTDIIITVPRKHSFLGTLFKESHTKKLAYRSHLPILAIHSWEK